MIPFILFFVWVHAHAYLKEAHGIPQNIVNYYIEYLRVSYCYKSMTYKKDNHIKYMIIYKDNHTNCMIIFSAVL